MCDPLMSEIVIDRLTFRPDGRWYKAIFIAIEPTKPAMYYQPTDTTHSFSKLNDTFLREVFSS